MNSCPHESVDRRTQLDNSERVLIYFNEPVEPSIASLSLRRFHSLKDRSKGRPDGARLCSAVIMKEPPRRPDELYRSLYLFGSSCVGPDNAAHLKY